MIQVPTLATPIQIIVFMELSSNKIHTGLRWNHIKQTITSHNNELILPMNHYLFDTPRIRCSLQISGTEVIKSALNSECP